MNDYRIIITSSSSKDIKIKPPKQKQSTSPENYYSKNPTHINTSGCITSPFQEDPNSIHSDIPRLSMEDINKMGVSVITCTNRGDFVESILNNFLTQTFNKKELIIILNNNQLNLKKWQQKTQKYDTIHVYQLDESITLGQCLNYGVKKCNYGFIAKFDDDDYYGSNYLSDSLSAFTFTRADVVGKAATYVYFKNRKTLAIRNGRRANRYVSRIEGPTLIMKKVIFESLHFADKNLGEDVQFCKDCLKKGFKIYSHNIFHHAYIRYGLNHKHTWGVGDEYYLKLCKIIGTVENLKHYVDHPNRQDKL